MTFQSTSSVSCALISNDERLPSNFSIYTCMAWASLHKVSMVWMFLSLKKKTLQFGLRKNEECLLFVFTLYADFIINIFYLSTCYFFLFISHSLRHYSARCPRLPQRPWFPLLRLLLLPRRRDAVVCCSAPPPLLPSVVPRRMWLRWGVDLAR